MKVKKRNGEESEIEFDEITKKIKNLSQINPPLNIDAQKLAIEVISLIYDGITTSELDEFTASTSASMSLYDTDYEILASRLIINNHQKNTSNSFCDTILQLNYIIDDNILNLCKNHKSLIDNLIVHDRDYNISYFGFNTLYNAYLLKDNITKKPIERPQYLFMRVSIGLHFNGTGDANELIHPDTITKIINTYNLLSCNYFTHATPTLFHCGTKYPQLSSCYLIGTEDSVDGIYKTISDVAKISKWAGGVGVHISNIRATGSNISKTNGKSQGIIPMLKVYNDTARYINQSSKRNGSFAIYLEPWHSDVFEFLEAKKNIGPEEIRARDLFYALWIPDLFMERLKAGTKWSLMCPNQCPGLTDAYGKDFDELYQKYESEGNYIKQVDIIELWNAIINSQIETGTPYMCYKDAVNRKSNQMNIGTIKSSNLCVEIELVSDNNETAVCNLASICLPKCVSNFNLNNIKYITNMHNSNAIKIYSKDDCIYCTKAKNLLKSLDIQFDEIMLNDKNNRIEFYEKYTDEETGVIVNSMPQIFIMDKNKNWNRIGGFQELQEYFKPKFDFEILSEITETIVENLNIVIDKNYYPTENSLKSNLKHRPIGIGVQGLADVFMLLKIPFTSDAAKKLNKDIFEVMYFHALRKSNELSNKYGTYETFIGSPASKGILQYDMWNKTPEKISLDIWKTLKYNIQKYGLRNSVLMALMPTASTAQIMGNNESFEPYTSNLYTRRVLAGEFILVNKHLINYLKENNLFNKTIIDQIILNKGSIQNINEIPIEGREIFKTVWEISQKSLLEMSADRGPYICQSQSMNIFLDKVNAKVINSVHMYGYSLGLKTGSYYIRTKSALENQNFNLTYDQEKKNGIFSESRDLVSKSHSEPCLSCSA